MAAVKIAEISLISAQNWTWRWHETSTNFLAPNVSFQPNTYH